MKMYEVKIDVLGDDIVICQPDGADGECVVVISPEQAELVCKWIMDAAKRAPVAAKQASLRD